jgi:hypothetical protein
VITSYAVAEAITVPLTDWMSHRFGAVRVFILAVFLFGVFSLMCGISTTLGMLLGMRVLQGMAGGPLLALSRNCGYAMKHSCIRHRKESRAARHGTLRAARGSDRGSWIMKVGLSSTGGQIDHTVLAELVSRRWKEARPSYTLNRTAREVWLEASSRRRPGDIALDLRCCPSFISGAEGT